ncbi:MAG: LysM peptidoglycan-binding domain-containing protein [Firmicutes bacterium]|nr:LysM peptidoglycan-binding domain-containing protein [Bacillota bacterium]
MDLPKNITQIGEINHGCKIYVEDYVVSYIKQLNGHALDKELAVGMYGVRKEEGGITYLFFYGACKLNFLQRETRHLSQAVLQEAEKARKKYFAEYDFLGYRLLNGEMVEGFHVYEQGVCRYVEGYAQFYEKNDSMLRFMVDERQEEAKPEEFDQAKYDVVKRRQEERRQKAEAQSLRQGRRQRSLRAGGTLKSGQKESGKDTRLRQMKMTAAAVFVVLCGAGLATVGNGGGLGGLRQAARELVEGMSTQQLPDSVEVSNGEVQVGTIVAEDKLTEAIQKENQAASGGMQESVPSPGPDAVSTTEPTATSTPEADTVSTAEPAVTSTPETDTVSTAEPAVTPTPETGAVSTSEPAIAQEPDPTPEPTSTPESTPTPEPVSYTIKRGDTLIGICMRQYGSDRRVAEICTLNNISNPDDIKIGQKILLPQ